MKISEDSEVLCAAGASGYGAAARSGAPNGIPNTFSMSAVASSLVGSVSAVQPAGSQSDAPSATSSDSQTTRRFHLAAKRVFDVAAALLAIILLAPFLITVAAIIKLTSRGPVFFRQARTGFQNQTFQIFKFRSMYTDRCDLSGVAQTVHGDPRITPIGRILRRTSIDELPQLINVLIGDMSLVGPRPHVPGMLAAGRLYEDLVPGYEQRHAMRPGITGLAQVNGLRGPTTEIGPSVARVERDLEYIREFNIWLDIKIIFQTIAVELRGGKGF